MLKKSLYLLLFISGIESFGFAIQDPVKLPVYHPVYNRGLSRTRISWTSNLGAWGENIVSMRLEREGFQVVEIKNTAGNGLDRIALRRGADGRLRDVRLIEVKTRYPDSPVRLGHTNHGTQLSRQWVARKFKEMRNLGTVETRRLAREISLYSRRAGIPLERLTELHVISQSTGSYKVIDPLTNRLISESTINYELVQIEKSTNQRQVRRWARMEQRGQPRVRRTSMSDWVRPRTVRNSRFVNISRSSVDTQPLPQKFSAKKILKGKSVVRFLSRTAIVIAIAVDSNAVYRVYRAYDKGEIDQRVFHTQLSQTGGGIAGAWVGSKAGAAAGFKFGLLGGPKAYITAPAGAIIFGIAGGFGGYMAGSYLGGYAGNAIYAHLDELTRNNINAWISSLPVLPVNP